MKHEEENYNASVSTVSTDLSLTEYKQGNDVFTNTISEDLHINYKIYENDSKEPLWKIRYGIVVISFLIYFFVLYARLNLSINIVAMVNNSAVNNQKLFKSESCPSLIQNFTEDGKFIKKEGDIDWSPKIQGYILGAFSIGQFTSQIPGGLLSDRFGAKWLVFSSTLIASVCTLLIPVLSYGPLSILLIILALRGLVQGGLINPALTVLAANWFPKTERGSLFAFVLSGSCMGSCLGSTFSGYICDSAGGWPVSFYSIGAFGIFLSLIIIIFLFENPKEHPRISKSELNFILSNQENILSRKRPKLPWRKVLTSIPVYALTLVYFGQAWAQSLFWTVHSTFLATILHYPIKENGLLTALPFVIQFLMSQIASWSTLYIQKKNICTVDFLRKFWAFVGSAGISLCLLGMYLSGCNRTLSIVFSVLCTGFTGFSFSSCWIVSTDMTPTFAGSLNAFCLTLSLPSTFLVPVVVGYLTDEMQTIEQWYKVFFISIGIVMSTGIIFTLFGSAEVQSWNYVEDETTHNNKIKTNMVKEKSENAKNEEQTGF